MSTRILVLKDGVITPAKTSTDTTNIINSLGVVDLVNNQTIGGIKIFSGGFALPTTIGTSIGTVWRNADNLEYKDSANVTRITLNSAGNLSNLSNRQTALNNLSGAVTTGTYLRGNGTNVLLSTIQVGDIPTLNQNTTGTASNITGVLSLLNGGTGATTQQAAINALVGTQTVNRVLRSNGTNMLLAQVGLTTDVTGTLPIANGGTNSITQNFVDLTTTQTVAGEKSFSNILRVTNTTDSTSTTTGASIILGGQGITGNQYIGGILSIGGQIQFPSTPVFSANTRILDDYVEGVFSPVIIGLTTAGVGTYSLQKGAFSKIGKRVFFELYLGWTAHTGTGFCRITGLPYTSANDALSAFSPVNLWHRNFVLTANNTLIGYVLEAGTNIVITQVPTGGGAQTGVALASSGDIMVSGHYLAIN